MPGRRRILLAERRRPIISRSPFLRRFHMCIALESILVWPAFIGVLHRQRRWKTVEYQIGDTVLRDLVPTKPNAATLAVEIHCLPNAPTSRAPSAAGIPREQSCASINISTRYAIHPKTRFWKRFRGWVSQNWAQRGTSCSSGRSPKQLTQ
jgi:hypothetical protein